MAALQTELDTVLPEKNKGDKHAARRQALPPDLPRRQILHEPQSTNLQLRLCAQAHR